MLTAIIEESFAGLRGEQVIALLEQAGIASARLRTPEELTRHPQLRARHRVRRVSTLAGTSTRSCRPSKRTAKSRPWEPYRRGEHTRAVRAEFGTGSPDGPGQA